MVLTYVANSLFVVYFPIRQVILTIQRWRASKQRSALAGALTPSTLPSRAHPLSPLWQRDHLHQNVICLVNSVNGNCKRAQHHCRPDADQDVEQRVPQTDGVSEEASLVQPPPAEGTAAPEAQVPAALSWRQCLQAAAVVWAKPFERHQVL